MESPDFDASLKSLEDSRAWRLFVQISEDGGEGLSPAELRGIQRKVYEAARAAYKVNTTLSGWNKTLMDYWWTPNRILVNQNHGAIRKALMHTVSATDRLARFIFPLAPPRYLFRTPASQAFAKQFRNPAYQPSAAELQSLRKAGLLKFFEERQAFWSAHPNWLKARAYLNYAYYVAYYSAGLAAVNHYMQLRDSGSVLLSELLDDAQLPDKDRRFALGDHQVQVIVDLVPFPHLSIRIGDDVFSYGQTHLQVSHYLHYFSITRMQREQQKRDEYADTDHEEESASNGSLGRSAGAADSPFKRALGSMGRRLGKEPHSAQIITLNLSREERDKLKRYLVYQTGKEYHNITAVNDCATMIVRALKLHTSFDFSLAGVDGSFLIDASPSEVAMYFSLLKTLGDDRVESVQTLLTEKEDREKRHLLRNLLINTAEARLFAWFFVTNTARRGYLAARYSPEELQWWSESTEEILLEWKKDYREFLYLDHPVIGVLLEGLDRQEQRAERGEPIVRAQIEALRSAASSFESAHELYRARVDDADTDLLTLLQAEYALEVLPELERETHERIERLLAP